MSEKINGFCEENWKWAAAEGKSYVRGGFSTELHPWASCWESRKGLSALSASSTRDGGQPCESSVVSDLCECHNCENSVYLLCDTE